MHDNEFDEPKNDAGENEAVTPGVTETSQTDAVTSNPVVPESDSEASSTEKKSFFDLLYGIIASPVATFRYISKTKPVLLALVVYAIVYWVGTIASIPGTINQLEQMPPEFGELPFLNPRTLTLFALIGGPFIALIMLAIITGIYHLIAKLLKGTGEYVGLLSVAGFANFPSLFSAPFALLDLVAPGDGAMSLSHVLLAFIKGSVSFGILVWTVILTIIGIRENYKFSTGRAVLTYFIPVIVLGLILLVFAILVAVFVIGAINSMGSGSF